VTSLIRKEIPVFLTGLIGAIMLADYYFPFVPVQIAAAELQKWVVIISAFAIFTSTFRLLLFHGKKIIKLESGQWYISAWMIGIFSLMLFVGVIYSTRDPIYVWLFNNVYYTLSASTNSLMGFFIAAAAYRAFKVKSFEAGILLVTAIIVAFTNVPIGVMIYKDWSLVGTWIRSVVNTAGFRGILIGSAVGSVILGIRRLVGRGGGMS
jgi:hypothetical protein